MTATYSEIGGKTGALVATHDYGRKVFQRVASSIENILTKHSYTPLNSFVAVALGVLDTYAARLDIRYMSPRTLKTAPAGSGRCFHVSKRPLPSREPSNLLPRELADHDMDTPTLGLPHPVPLTARPPLVLFFISYCRLFILNIMPMSCCHFGRFIYLRLVLTQVEKQCTTYM